MGSLMIKQVIYSGDKYEFISVELSDGINIIEGDNGSGKSTFSYFIEYGLGIGIKIFDKDSRKEKYQEIINDTNNYVELKVLLNSIEYIFKRYIGKNDIFVLHPDGKSIEYCIYRTKCKKTIFSDWLLDKLEIKKFQLNFGTHNWYFGFSDLFRLLHYDQDTDTRRVFKAPPADKDNFVTDSSLSRKSIFETLLTSNSDDYFLKHNELNDKKIAKDEAKYFWDEFNKKHPNLDKQLKDIIQLKEASEEQLGRLIDSRNKYLKENTRVDDKFKDIEDKKETLTRLELENIDLKRNLQILEIENQSVESLYEEKKHEIETINKSIMTNDKLNIFNFELCPFCATDIPQKKNNVCICGAEIKDTSYENFLYNSNEYQTILKSKEKSLQTIKSTIEINNNDLVEIQQKIKSNESEIKKYNQQIKEAIESIEYSGNHQMVDTIDDYVSKVRKEIHEFENEIEIYQEKERLENSFNTRKKAYDEASKQFKFLENQFVKNSQNVIDRFNEIYNSLMIKSACEAEKASIDEEYMPYVDNGKYREKSAGVSIRMMYYFTLLCLELSYHNTNHPKFLLMDTPEDSGIDNIEVNIKLFDKLLEIAQQHNTTIPKYQYILTTAIGRYPQHYRQYIKIRFNKKENKFILKRR